MRTSATPRICRKPSRCSSWGSVCSAASTSITPDAHPVPEADEAVDDGDPGAEPHPEHVDLGAVAHLDAEPVRRGRPPRRRRCRRARASARPPAGAAPCRRAPPPPRRPASSCPRPAATAAGAPLRAVGLGEPRPRRRVRAGPAEDHLPEKGEHGRCSLSLRRAAPGRPQASRIGPGPRPRIFPGRAIWTPLRPEGTRLPRRVPGSGARSGRRCVPSARAIPRGPAGRAPGGRASRMPRPRPPERRP